MKDLEKYNGLKFKIKKAKVISKGYEKYIGKYVCINLHENPEIKEKKLWFYFKQIPSWTTINKSYKKINSNGTTKPYGINNDAIRLHLSELKKLV